MLFLPSRRDNADIRPAWSDLRRIALGDKSSSPVKWIPKTAIMARPVIMRSRPKQRMRSGRRRLQSVERALLHGEIRLKVHVRRGGAFMTQPQRDHCDVDARLQEMHRRGVADGVRRYRAACEPGVTLGGGRHRKLQALGDV